MQEEKKKETSFHSTLKSNKIERLWHQNEQNGQENTKNY
jgi:hypothetical protein